MGHELRYICRVEARSLIWLIGAVFTAVLLLQYLELPYSHVVSSLFSSGNAQEPIRDSSGNITLFDVLNSTETNVVHEIHNKTKSSEVKDASPIIDNALERNGGSENSLESDEYSDPENEVSADDRERNNNSATDKLETENGLSPIDVNNSSLGTPENNISLVSKENGSLDTGSLEPIIPSPHFTPRNDSGTKAIGPVVSINPNAPTEDKEKATAFSNEQTDRAVKIRSEVPLKAVVSVPEMYDLLIQSRASSFSMKPRWSSAVDHDLLIAKSQILNAPIVENDRELYAPLYRNVSMFRRSYELMAQTLKVYIYKEGERPIFHQPVLKGIYASEGWFMKLLKANKQFVTKSPKRAHLFYLPFSSRLLEEVLYVPNSHSHKNLIQHLKNYLNVITGKYTFWNRTAGADHFLVACHDWAPSETKKYMAKCIRALCNADIKEGFKLGKDVSLPETYVRSAQNPLRQLGGNHPSKRKILAFFAGNMHGYVRPILLNHWENKDPDMKISGPLAKGKRKMTYAQYMKSTKYCICAKGYEVNSPRVVEAIFYECVPVIISDNFVPPFFEVLNWESFAVFVLEKDIPNLKNILLSIPEKKYLEMQRRVKMVYWWLLKFRMPNNIKCSPNLDKKCDYSKMSPRFHFMCQTETKRFIWFLGITFAIVIVVQYFELPSSRVLSSLLSTAKVPFLGKNSSQIEDLSYNSTKMYALEDTSNNTDSDVLKKEITLGNEEKERWPKNDSLLERNGSSSGVFGSVRNTTSFEKSNLTLSSNNTSMTGSPAGDKKFETPTTPVMSLPKMNDLLLQSHSSPHSTAPRWSSKVDQELLDAKLQIENAPIIENDTELYEPLYRNVSMFKRSYELMEKMLKVYIYKEGEKPIFHESILEGIYASEGWFLKLLEANKQFVTENPRDTHLFYIPFSSRLLELTLYVRNSHKRDNLIQYMKNYVEMIAAKYPFWNRTDGADHFLAACHDWAPSETRGRMLKCLRALCNADIKAGFEIGKDVSLPATYVRSAQNPLKDIGGNPPSNRTILAFFAGHMHGNLRPILLKYWGKDDPALKIFGELPHVKGNKNYIEYMKSSKYCICARGYEVYSPRVVESMFYDCVPVIVSDNYVPPFFEVLDWESFSVFVLENDIADLKNILLSISNEKYLEMQQRVKKVKQHFLWHSVPVKYDLFHMVLHSIWYNRIFQMRHI